VIQTIAILIISQARNHESNNLKINAEFGILNSKFGAGIGGAWSMNNAELIKN
jgi:hypothetical protein